jgi:hypothetical protein
MLKMYFSEELSIESPYGVQKECLQIPFEDLVKDVIISSLSYIFFPLLLMDE